MSLIKTRRYMGRWQTIRSAETQRIEVVKAYGIERVDDCFFPAAVPVAEAVVPLLVAFAHEIESVGGKVSLQSDYVLALHVVRDS